MDMFILRTTCKYVFLAITIVLMLLACSSGGSDNNTTATGKTLTLDQIAFSETVFPVLRNNCSSCHSDTGDPNLVQLAHSNVAVAHAVIKNRGFVNLQLPSNSRFVVRLIDEHHCWTSCTDDSNAMVTAISQWNAVFTSNNNDNNNGNTSGNNYVTSVDAFVQSLYPLLNQHCSSCHDGNMQFAALASPDSQTAHNAILNSNLADLNNPGNSDIVTFLSEKDHNCWSDCALNADTLATAVTQWQQLLTDNGDSNRNNRPPIANNDNYTTKINLTLLTDNVLLNDSDPNNDTLGISNFDAATTQGGFVQNNLNGTFTYTPPNGFVGIDTFSYTISDEKSGSANATVFVTVIQNTAPVARRDLIKTNKNTPVIITTLLDNDISGSGDPLSITSVDNQSVNNASLALNANGSITYTPLENFNGIDLFTYSITDGQGTASARVEVDVNINPIAVSDAVYTYININTNTGSVIRNDHDVNGDALTVSSFDPSSVQSGNVSSNGDGTFVYTPPDGFTGNDSFDYIVSDGRGGTASATVFVSIISPILRDDNRFLAFLNQSADAFSESAATATAYYRAVDPLDQRTTLDAWRILNGFNIGTDAFAVYINNNDLGFARRMFVRTDLVTGVVSSYVENYATLEDAENETNVIATVAMEHNVAPGYDPLDPEAQRYVSFYVFDNNDDRALSADLDGRGQKFVPGLCNVCHGGRPNALVNGIYPDNGNTGAGFIPWDLDTYLFADDTAVVSREEQEDQFKIFNRSILATNPLPATREVIEGWYGGSTLPATTFNGGFIPDGWRTPAAPQFAAQLYTQSVGPNCRACHIMQGSPLQNDIDFASYDKFISYKARIETLVFDEGTMPLAKRTWDRFWETPFLPRTMAEFMNSPKLLTDNNILSPGRPIANAGSFREATLGRVELNGNSSLFTGGPNAFVWNLVSQPAGSAAVLQNTNQAGTAFTADVPGDYIAQLRVNDGLGETPSSPPAEVVIRVSATTLGTSFVNDIAPIFDVCAVCHLGFDNPKFNNRKTLYRNVINFVNTDDPLNSPILSKPSGQHHGGGTIQGFESPSSDHYKTVLQWIQEGARDN